MRYWERPVRRLHGWLLLLELRGGPADPHRYGRCRVAPLACTPWLSLTALVTRRGVPSSAVLLFERCLPEDYRGLSSSSVVSDSGRVVLSEGVRSRCSSSGAVGVGCVRCTGRQLRILLSHSGVALGSWSLVKVGRGGIGSAPSAPSVSHTGCAPSAALLLRLAICSAASLV